MNLSLVLSLVFLFVFSHLVPIRLVLFDPRVQCKQQYDTSTKLEGHVLPTAKCKRD